MLLISRALEQHNAAHAAAEGQHRAGAARQGVQINPEPPTFILTS